jgi:hypothetical protein
MTVKVGSTWQSRDLKQFVVIHLVEDNNGHTWVHYRDNPKKKCTEYSCYMESFLERFTELKV